MFSFLLETKYYKQAPACQRVVVVHAVMAHVIHLAEDLVGRCTSESVFIIIIYLKCPDKKICNTIGI